MIRPRCSRDAPPGAKLTTMANKRERHDTILEIIDSRVVSSQEDLRKLRFPGICASCGWPAFPLRKERDTRSPMGA
jgi:hypothetical protein